MKTTTLLFVGTQRDCVSGSIKRQAGVSKIDINDWTGSLHDALFMTRINPLSKSKTADHTSDKVHEQ
jgi:hypothetical protein